ncbi:hypothetical protein DFH06DRAFT_1294880 [Mycena polygramma]|nr:hypothetical protein DFH06DRAFT_1294880 [Mycena polygramma]
MIFLVRQVDPVGNTSVDGEIKGAKGSDAEEIRRLPVAWIDPANFNEIVTLERSEAHKVPNPTETSRCAVPRLQTWSIRRVDARRKANWPEDTMMRKTTTSSAVSERSSLDSTYYPDLRPIMQSELPIIIQALRQTQNREKTLTRDESATREMLRLGCLSLMKAISRKDVEESLIDSSLRAIAEDESLHMTLKSVAQQLHDRWETLPRADMGRTAKATSAASERSSLDSTYYPDLRPITSSEVPKIIQVLRQTRNRGKTVELLTRFRLTKDESAVREMLRLRCLSLMKIVLDNNSTDLEIICIVLISIRSWAVTSRNKVEESLIDSTLRAIAEDENLHKTIKSAAQQLLDRWETLPVTYTIPKRDLREKDGSPRDSPPAYHVSDRGFKILKRRRLSPDFEEPVTTVYHKQPGGAPAVQFSVYSRGYPTPWR